MASDITAAVKALVKKPVAAAKVTLNATSKKITTGKSFTLKATVAPSIQQTKLYGNPAIPKLQLYPLTVL